MHAVGFIPEEQRRKDDDVLEGNRIYRTKEDWEWRLSPAARGPDLKTEVEPSVRIVSRRIVNGKAWLEVTIFDAGFCEAPKPKGIAKGWVPRHQLLGA
jgi:hypothetical protein